MIYAAATIATVMVISTAPVAAPAIRLDATGAFLYHAIAKSRCRQEIPLTSLTTFILFEFPDSYLGISGSSRLVHISCVHSGSVSAILCCSSYNSTLIASRSCSVRDGGGVMSSRG